MPLKKTSEPFGISQSICTRTRNLTRYLHQNPPEPHQASSPPKPSQTSEGLCTGTFRNLTRYLHQNPPEPHQASSPPKPSQTSEDLCTGTFRNLTRYLPRSLTTHLHLDPHQVAAPETSGTLRRHLHRNPPEAYGTFFGKNAEAFKLLGIAPEFILNKRDDVLS